MSDNIYNRLHAAANLSRVEPCPATIREGAEYIKTQAAEIATLQEEIAADTVRWTRAETALTSAADRLIEDRVTIGSLRAEIHTLKRERGGSATCPECGEHARIDEDGCCVVCGSDCAPVPGLLDTAETLRARIAELEVLVEQAYHEGHAACAEGYAVDIAWSDSEECAALEPKP